MNWGEDGQEATRQVKEHLLTGRQQWSHVIVALFQVSLSIALSVGVIFSL